MRKLLCLIVLLLMVAPSAIAQTVPPPLEGVKTIVTLGDSITEQGGQPGGYVWLLQRSLDALYPSQSISVINAGISGHKSTDMQARFQRDVLDRKPNLVTISVGVNDVWHGFYDNHPEGDGPRGVSLAQYREKLAEMILAARKEKVKVALVAPTVIHEEMGNRENAKLTGYVAAMKDLAKKHGCLFIDLNAAFRDILRTYHKYAPDGPLLLTVDGVHMNAAGNRVMADTILRGLGVADQELSGLAPNLK